MISRTMAEELDDKPLDFSIIRRLLGYLKPYKRNVVISILLILVTSFFGPIRPYLSKIAIDDYISKSDWYGLVQITALIFGLLILQAALQFFLTYLMQWVGQEVLYDIRMKLYNHILSMSMSFFDKNPVGRLVTRVTNDVEALNQLFSSGVIMIFADILLLFWIIIFMLATSWKMALITMLVMPFLLVVSIVFRKKVRVIYRAIRQQVSRMNTFLNEFISGISTIKLFSQEHNLFKKFDEINKEHNRLQVRTVLYYSLFFPVIELLSACTLGLIIWYSGANVLSKEITVGVVIAFMQYAEMFFRPIRDMTEKYTTLQSAMASAERIFTTLDTTDVIEDRPDSIEFRGLNDKIEFKHVSFSYDGIKPVLVDVNFEIHKGETIAIVGATGSGKTTLINLLCRFYDTQDGEILFDGINLKDYNQKSLRSHISLVMQDVFLFSRTIEENISLGSESVGKGKVKIISQMLGADKFIVRLNGGYSEKLIERGDSLSFGQKQLLAFCRALAFEPSILILDEATSNIDSETEGLIESALEKLTKGRTSIIIAHRLSTIRRADKIIVLHHGKVREIGNHEELLKMNGIYSRLYRLQKQGLISEV